MLKFEFLDVTELNLKKAAVGGGIIAGTLIGLDRMFGSEGSEEWQYGDLDIIVWKVDLGTAIFANGPKENIVIDMADREEFSPVENLKHKKGSFDIQNLDRVIISHPDEDHIDDIEKFYELCYKGGDL
jgi:beta-lactamase superfamily II metal-dependent hydrolase